MSRTMSNTAIIQSVYEAFNANDIDRAVVSASDEFELTDMATGRIYRGPDGFRAWLQSWKEFMPDARAEVTNGVAVGDWVATEHVGRGTHTGPLTTPMGKAAPTGRMIELKFAEVCLLRRSRLVRMRSYWDAASLLGQVGLLSWPGPCD